MSVGGPRTRIAADITRCCGSGMCVLSAPEVFGQNDDDGVVEILVAEPEPEQLTAVRTAVQGCPTSAISLEEG